MNARSFPGGFVVIAVIAVLAVAAAPALAQKSPSDKGVAVMGQWISYAAKFVCGNEIDTSPPPSIVLGKYRTAVNIHNPHYLQDVQGVPLPAVFYKKVVLAKPQGEPLLPPTCKQREELPADHALLVDCNNIKDLLALSGLPTTGDKEGFVVIEVPPQPTMDDAAPYLDVVSVFTARNRSGADTDLEIETMDVERVEPTAIIGEPNLDNPCNPPG